jgi:hypothetical protein
VCRQIISVVHWVNFPNFGGSDAVVSMLDITAPAQLYTSFTLTGIFLGSRSVTVYE